LEKAESSAGSAAAGPAAPKGTESAANPSELRETAVPASPEGNEILVSPEEVLGDPAAPASLEGAESSAPPAAAGEPAAPASSEGAESPASPESPAPLEFSGPAPPGEHAHPRYRGLYLLGPLPDPRGLAQEIFSLTDQGSAYPEELAEAVRERAAISEELKKLQTARRKKDSGSSEFLRLNQAIASFDRRLALRWERIRSNHLKLARSLGTSWSDCLTSLNLKYRFLSRSLQTLSGILEQSGRLRQISWLLRKTMHEIQEAFPESEVLAGLELPPESKETALRRTAGSFMAGLEKERLDVLDQILFIERKMDESQEAGRPLAGPPPEPVRVPQLSARVQLPGRRSPAGRMRTLSVAAVVLLLVTVAAVFGYRRFFPAGPPNLRSRVLIFNGLPASATMILNRDRSLVLGPGSAALISLAGPAQAAVRMTDKKMPVEEVTLTPPSPADIDSTLIYNIGAAVPLVEWSGESGQPPPRNPRPLPLGAPRFIYTQAHYFYPSFGSAQNSVFLWAPRGNSASYLAVSGVIGVHPDLMLAALKASQSSQESQNPEARNIVFKQARFSPDWDQWSPYWGVRLARLDPGEALEVMLLRQTLYDSERWSGHLFYELSGPPERMEFCQDILAQLAMDPDNHFWQYLLAGCMPRDEREKHIREILSETRDIWFYQLLAREEFSQGRYVEACRLWKSVLSSQPQAMAEDLEDLARVEHYLDAPLTEIFDEINPWAPDLGQDLILENGAHPSRPDWPLGRGRAYYLLSRGKIEEALALAGGTFREEFLPLAAASDGASEELLLEILAQDPAENLTPDNAWTKWSLALNNGQETSQIEEYILAEAGENREALQKILEHLHNREPWKIADLLPGLTGRLIGGACLAAVLTNDDRINCRERAKGFLFVTERPYLK
jgi:hypothetical protein